MCSKKYIYKLNHLSAHTQNGRYSHTHPLSFLPQIRLSFLLYIRISNQNIRIRRTHSNYSRTKDGQIRCDIIVGSVRHASRSKVTRSSLLYYSSERARVRNAHRLQYYRQSFLLPKLQCSQERQNCRIHRNTKVTL